MGWGGYPPPPPGKNDPGWLRVARDSCTLSLPQCLDEERITTLLIAIAMPLSVILSLPQCLDEERITTKLCKVDVCFKLGKSPPMPR